MNGSEITFSAVEYLHSDNPSQSGSFLLWHDDDDGDDISVLLLFINNDDDDDDNKNNSDDVESVSVVKSCPEGEASTAH